MEAVSAGASAGSSTNGSSTGTSSTSTDWDALADPAYPTSSTAELGEPVQTLEPLLPIFDGIALPSTWSRLHAPLQRALEELWNGSGLLERDHPRQWVTLHFGRMALHARGWERLRSTAHNYRPDLARLDSAPRGLDALRERWERFLV
jgi:hypothetical protein